MPPDWSFPPTVAQQLGLDVADSVTVRYADGRTAERPIVKGISLAYGGRESVFSAIVEPEGESVLIGAIVLEDLDFLVDCINHTARAARSEPDYLRNRMNIALIGDTPSRRRKCLQLLTIP